jgi:hypothetical protein
MIQWDFLIDISSAVCTPIKNRLPLIVVCDAWNTLIIYTSSIRKTRKMRRALFPSTKMGFSLQWSSRLAFITVYYLVFNQVAALTVEFCSNDNTATTGKSKPHPNPAEKQKLIDSHSR